MIDHHQKSDVLSLKTYNTRSGRDPPSIVWIPLTVHSKLGVSLTFGSRVILCQI